MLTYRETELLDTGTGNAQGKNQVTEDPEKHQVGSECFVGVIHALVLFLLDLHKWGQRSLDGGLKLAIDIGLRLVYLLDEVRFGIIFLGLSFGQSLTFVGPLGTPRDVMPVTKGIHHEDVD